MRLQRLVKLRSEQDNGASRRSEIVADAPGFDLSGSGIVLDC